jgi:hypothetical protein
MEGTMLLRRLGWTAVAAITLLLALAPISAIAAGHTTITLNSLSSGETFTATGGVICASGTATTDFDHFGGGPVAGSFHLTKTLTCTDGSGTITIRVNAATVFGSPTDQGGWAVVSGTGDYTSLSGGGNVVGTYVADGIIDLYTGVLRN